MPERMTEMGSFAETTAPASANTGALSLLPASGHWESLPDQVSVLSALNKAPCKTIDFLCFWGLLKCEAQDVFTWLM